MEQENQRLEIKLPEWLADFADQYIPSKNIEDRMRFVLSAAEKNIDEQSGGPFSAAIFESRTGKLIALSVNLVPSQKLSVLHAEILAISLAQQQLQTFDLSPHHLELVTSTEPCAMCLGAIPWSGIEKVICGATAEHAEEIGFDEGDKPQDWTRCLEKRNITVLRKVCVDEAQAVLQHYVANNGQIYIAQTSPHKPNT